MIHLILQVLGNSDILVDGQEGYQQLKGCYNLEDIEQKAEWNDEVFLNQLDRVNFPLIQKFLNSHQNSHPPDTEILFGIILTDQVRWMQQRGDTGEEWDKVVTSDGIWWQNILSKWCLQQNINYYPILLDVKPEIPYGVADWEGMAATVDTLFDDFLVVQENSIYFQPQESEKIQVDKILIQHSSGTPALSSALYLWGIEQKLAGVNIEFVYISEQEVDCPPHSGEHWQWRLKVPQILQLLEIQDFSGALKLLDKHHPKYQQLADSLLFLDKSVSLNLEGRNLEGKDSIIERVSIALWSEKAFRDRSQWMHWYLRIAGALELALFVLVEQQSQGNYQWKKHKLICVDGTKKVEVNRCPISSIVNQLLTAGEFDYLPFANSSDPPTKLLVSPITDSQWSDFKKFYLDNWELEENPQQALGFTSARNQLYHNLIGDRIDHLLDDQTRKLHNQVDHPEHPSQIAVNWLNYIIQLAGLSAQVEAKSKVYRDRVSEIVKNLHES